MGHFSEPYEDDCYPPPWLEEDWTRKEDHDEALERRNRYGTFPPASRVEAEEEGR